MKPLICLMLAVFLASAQKAEAQWQVIKKGAKITTYQNGTCVINANHKSGMLVASVRDQSSSLGPIAQHVTIKWRDGKYTMETVSEYLYGKTSYRAVLPEGWGAELFQVYCAKTARQLPRQVRAMFRGYYGVKE